jgi:hypothetical protein
MLPRLPLAALLLAALLLPAAGFEFSTDIGKISGYTALAPKANWLRKRQNTWAQEDVTKTLQKQAPPPSQSVQSTAPANQLTNAPPAFSPQPGAVTQAPANAQGQTQYLLQIPAAQLAQTIQNQPQLGFLRYFVIPQQTAAPAPAAQPVQPVQAVQPMPVQQPQAVAAPPQAAAAPPQAPQPAAPAATDFNAYAAALVTLKASRLNILSQWSTCLNSAKAAGKDGLDEDSCQAFLLKSIELNREIKAVVSRMDELKKQFDVTKILGQIWKNGN